MINKKRSMLVWYFLCILCALAYSSSAIAQSMILQNYDQSSVPKNKEGTTYPTYYDGGSEGGPFTVTLDKSDAISGGSLVMSLSSGQLYAQFNPYDGIGRGFARDYAACGYPAACGNPTSWQYNTYTKMRFWLKVPTNAGAPDYTSGHTCNVGTYVKQVTNADSYSDEAGGGHFYHGFSPEPTGTWWQVILPMHPNHERGVDHVDPGYIPYITSVDGSDPSNTYNYWDTLTRWYIQCEIPGNPWKLDGIEFYKDPIPEDDNHLASALLATYVPSSNKIIVNWNRRIQDDGPLWDVRYAFSDIHSLGWSNATVAPGSPVKQGWCCDYIQVHYSTTAIPTAGQSVLYIAVKSQLEPTKFNQIAIPLSGSQPPIQGPPAQVPTAPNALIVQ